MYKLLLFSAGAFLLISACSDSGANDAVPVELPEKAPPRKDVPFSNTTDSAKVLQLADSIIHLLDRHDLKGLGALIGDKKEVWCSPYAYINPGNDNQIGKAELTSSAEVEYSWGSYDGTGAPIVLNIRKYFDRFVYSHPYATDTSVIVSYNTCKGSGNSLNNIESAYQGHCFVEYYYPGKHERDYMDWSCLRLVFKKADGHFQLVGIVHDEWTV